MRSREILVTAGHLRNEFKEARREKNFQASEVEAIVEHRLFVWNNTDLTSDIVMLKLKTPFSLNDYVQKICLPPPEFKADRKIVNSDRTKSPVCLITGWGQTEGRGNNANLQQATIPVRCFVIYPTKQTFRFTLTSIVMNYLEMVCYRTTEIFAQVI